MKSDIQANWQRWKHVIPIQADPMLIVPTQHNAICFFASGYTEQRKGTAPVREVTTEFQRRLRNSSKNTLSNVFNKRKKFVASQLLALSLC